MAPPPPPPPAHPESSSLLVALAGLVVAAKVGGIVAVRLRQPPVLGELLVGIVLGNLLLPFIGGEAVALGSDPTLRFLAELGVLILLFDVGLDSDIGAMRRVGTSAVLVALIGATVPAGLGWAVAVWFLADASPLVHAFIGATLSATSVGITARVLRDLGKMNSVEGRIILGAALIDDVLGLIVLAVASAAVTAAATGGAGLSGLSILGIVGRAAVFLAATVTAGHYFSTHIVRFVGRIAPPGTMLVVGLALCFTLAWLAERIGLAAIVGAFAAGLLLDPYGRGVRSREDEASLTELLQPIGGLFVPLFFILMGLQVQVGTVASGSMLLFAVAISACAVVGKVAAGLGALHRDVDRVSVGIGMVPRGEVGLIFAGLGTTLVLDGKPLLSDGIFSAVVIMVLMTTLIAPIGLRWSMSRRRSTAT
jgi:Kef-type K+ transport system membrane component KefB